MDPYAEAAVFRDELLAKLLRDAPATDEELAALHRLCDARTEEEYLAARRGLTDFRMYEAHWHRRSEPIFIRSDAMGSFSGQAPEPVLEPRPTQEAMSFAEWRQRLMDKMSMVLFGRSVDEVLQELEAEDRACRELNQEVAGDGAGTGGAGKADHSGAAAGVEHSADGAAS